MSFFGGNPPDVATDGVLSHVRFRAQLKRVLRNWVRETQIGEFLGEKRSRGLKNFRSNWYFDYALLFSNAHAIRIIRRIRLGVSELLEHSFFFSQNRSKICGCHMRVVESPFHYFCVCPRYADPRKVLREKIRPILRRLDIPFSDRACLGFHPKLGNRQFEKHTRAIRLSLLQEVSNYIVSTSRFRYF